MMLHKAPINLAKLDYVLNYAPPSSIVFKLGKIPVRRGDENKTALIWGAITIVVSWGWVIVELFQ